MKFGTQSPWKSKSRLNELHTCYSLPGIIIEKNGEKKYAIFTCCIDKHNCCYHRGISYRKGPQDLVNEFRSLEGSWNLQIDEDLEQDEGFTYTKEYLERLHKLGIVEDTNNQFFVKIQDLHNGITIILFKINQES